MKKNFFDYDFYALEKKCKKFLRENPGKRITSQHLTVKYDKKMRCVAFRVRIELAD